jgi:hypothetical protein
MTAVDRGPHTKYAFGPPLPPLRHWQEPASKIDSGSAWNCKSEPLNKFVNDQPFNCFALIVSHELPWYMMNWLSLDRYKRLINF